MKKAISKLNDEERDICPLNLTEELFSRIA